MTDLLPYNPAFVGKGVGLSNDGNTCYRNSIMQCLLSCSSIAEVLEANEKKDYIQKSPLAVSLLALFRTWRAGGDISALCAKVWNYVLMFSTSRKDRQPLSHGAQEDAHEGMMLFLDILDTIPEIKRLFQHRHKINLYCDKCQKCAVVDKDEVNMAFEIQPELKTQQHPMFKEIDPYYNKKMPLNEFLRMQNTFADEDTECPNPECKKRGIKFRTTTLTMIPEILPILIKKYGAKVLTEFPEYLNFTAQGKKKNLIYKLVAQSEHAGDMRGGHYWAVCLRSDGWKHLNDGSVRDAQPGPTLNTYVLFYHFEKIVDVE